MGHDHQNSISLQNHKASKEDKLQAVCLSSFSIFAIQSLSLFIKILIKFTSIGFCLKSRLPFKEVKIFLLKGRF